MFTCDEISTDVRTLGWTHRAWSRICEDLEVVAAKDPAVKSRVEVLLYPHIHALWTYRLAHALYGRRHYFVARLLSQAARLFTGIEIHPGAEIGRRLFIDHGSGVVIGETVRIGDDVMLYHQVTLGSVGWWTDLRRAPNARRHPTLEDGVIVGTNASIFGSVTVGAGALIGAHAVVCANVARGARILPGQVYRGGSNTGSGTEYAVGGLLASIDDSTIAATAWRIA